MIGKLLSIYKPAPHIKPLTKEDMEKQIYGYYRLQIMISIFVGYAGYYLVRQNFSIAKPFLIKEMGLTTGDVGLIASALTIAYGISKFIMGNVSDRSNPRYFMATGLICSGLVNLFFGSLPSVWVMTAFWFINGWFQGMGWPAGARTMTHWFSDRERGTMFSVWNIAHNVGGGLVAPIATLSLYIFASYMCIFYVPAVMSILIGIMVIIFLRDTPQSVGLPSIEEFKDDYPDTGVEDREKELSAKEIILNFVLKNKFLWILAFANFFVYIVRYGVVNWAPTYLELAKGCPADSARWLVFVYEYAAIPGILLSGWISDRFFHGRRAPISVIYMVIVTFAVLVYWFNPAGRYLVDFISVFCIGFLIYGPVMLIGVAAVDLVPKKAAGTGSGGKGNSFERVFERSDHVGFWNVRFFGSCRETFPGTGSQSGSAPRADGLPEVVLNRIRISEWPASLPPRLSRFIIYIRSMSTFSLIF